jgi:predicted RecB family endonuclease
MGYRIIETHKRIVIEDVEVGEVDAIAIGPDNEYYAVEVKAGRLDVHGVRQVYSNAKLLGMRPLAICKGFADDAAKIVAEKLGVKVIELSDVFLVDAEELEEIVYGASFEAFSEAIRILLDPTIKPRTEYLDYIKAIASTDSMHEASRALNKDVKEVAEIVAWLRSLSPLARRGGYRSIRLLALLLLARYRLQGLIETLENDVERLNSLLSKLGV